MTKLAMAVAMLFAVNMNANAQLGGLLNKAKKVVTKETTQSAQEKRVKADYVRDHPREQEKLAAEAAGGMDKYLGLDKTENGRILWKYGSMEEWETSQIKNAWSAARYVIQVLRYLKGNTETFDFYKDTNHVLYIFNENIPGDLKRAAEKSKTGNPVPAKDIAAIKAYVQDIINKNYLLDNLTDKNRQAKAVADYKAKVNAKVKQQLAPTKILGTYSTSAAWQGLPLQNYPDLKEKYESVQEMQFKTFYEKGGKYYVVKSAFRQSIPKGDNKSGAQPQKFYWPGIETPIEIPAEKIQGKF